MENEVMVSVACITYNHEKYIADAIESFLMQKTNFKFEILIHDDASTDATARIIKEYEERYPDLIKPIYQTENKYSQGLDVDEINTCRAKGKYIAMCEGDDFWTDPTKLQQQYDYMESCPACSLCVHDAYIVYASGKRKDVSMRLRKSRKFSVEEIIVGGGALFATSSLFYRQCFDGNMPEFYKISPTGDYPLVIHLALKGEVYYIGKKMSAYRVGVAGSWTETEMKTLEKRTKHYREIAEMLDELDRYTDYLYQDTILNAKSRNEFELLIHAKRYDELKRGKYQEIYRSLSKRKRWSIFLREHFPFLVKKLQVHK
ncbi:glycosyltransferase [Eubacteriaceae bacterium ES3]|nr:glycosyltransferase [Eubacteriaceae bacterium ES3]